MSSKLLYLYRFGVPSQYCMRQDHHQQLVFLSSASAFCMAKLSSTYLNSKFNFATLMTANEHQKTSLKHSHFFTDSKLEAKRLKDRLHAGTWSKLEAHPSMVSTPSCNRRKDQKRLIDLIHKAREWDMTPYDFPTAKNKKELNRLNKDAKMSLRSSGDHSWMLQHWKRCIFRCNWAEMIGLYLFKNLEAHLLHTLFTDEKHQANTTRPELGLCLTDIPWPSRTWSSSFPSGALPGNLQVGKKTD